MCSAVDYIGSNIATTTIIDQSGKGNFKLLYISTERIMGVLCQSWNLGNVVWRRECGEKDMEL